MVFAILISYVVALLPLVFFLVAPVLEWRSAQKRMALFLRMGEIAVGIIIWAVPTAGYWGIMRVYGSSTSWTLVWISLGLGGLSLVSKYESRAALICALLGSTSLAFWSYFNGAY
jgi:hypothetical protein